MLIIDVLSDVPDPRGYNAVHDLTDVLFVALAAVLCGAVHCTEMAMFAETRLALNYGNCGENCGDSALNRHPLPAARRWPKPKA